jgi:hypothetical protein
MPLSRERATEVVRDIAKDSSRWVMLREYSAQEDWRKRVNARQVQLCLAEGYVLDDRATMDEHGHWRFRIARVCAGVNVVLDLALESETVRRPKLFVLSALSGHSFVPCQRAAKH